MTFSLPAVSPAVPAVFVPLAASLRQSQVVPLTTTGDHAADLALAAAFGQRDPDGPGDPRLGSGDPQ